MAKKPVTLPGSSNIGGDDDKRAAEAEAKRLAEAKKAEQQAILAADREKKRAEAAAAKAEKAAERQAAREAKESARLPTVKAGALSADVGVRVLEALDKADKDASKLEALKSAIDAKRYDALGLTTMAVLKAAQADDGIDLDAAFRTDKKASTKLNDQVRIALGLMEVRRIVDTQTKKEHRRLELTKAADKYFSKWTATQRTNFAHMLKKCIQAAAELKANNIKAAFDEKAGTLAITGPRVEELFGAPTVLLNEKQRVGEGDDAVMLKEKPSYTALAKAGAVERGAVMVKRGTASGETGSRADSRVAIADATTDANFGGLCKALIDAINKLYHGEGFSPRQLKALDGVESAIAMVKRGATDDKPRAVA